MTAIDEEVSVHLKIQVLDEHRPLLCSILDPKWHYIYLRSKFVLSQDEEELIEVQQLRKLKVHKLIDILKTKGRQGYDELVMSIINERTQIFLAEKLNKAFEEKRKKILALMNQNGHNQTQAEIESISQEHNATIQDSSVSSPCINSLNKTVSINSEQSLYSENSLSADTRNENSTPALTRYQNTISDLGIDTEKLPKPTMPKSNQSNTSNEFEKLRIKSCENSFDEDSEEMKSSDSESFLQESRA